VAVDDFVEEDEEPALTEYMENFTKKMDPVLLKEYDQ